MVEDRTKHRIEQLVRRVRDRRLSRSEFTRLLTGMGASATGIGVLLASVDTVSADKAAAAPVGGTSREVTARHAQLHHEHVQRQAQVTRPPTGSNGDTSVHAFRAQKLREIMADYADTAVVEDPLLDAPIVGKHAIARRKIAEMTAMHGVTIQIVNRFAHRNQVVAEWIVQGVHHGAFLGFAPTGRSIELRGMTVVTREHEKITRESLFYDLAELHRQLT